MKRDNLSSLFAEMQNYNLMVKLTFIFPSSGLKAAVFLCNSLNMM